MPEESKGILSTGAGLVLRHQSVLWWVFAVNLVLGGLGASGAARTLSDTLSHSLAGEALSKGFDVGMLLELAQQPEVRLFSRTGMSFVFAVLFFLFMLFVTGGILAVYLQDRKLTTAEFFEASGGYFWPMVRLMLWSLIPFVIVDFLYQGVSKLSGYVGDHAVDERNGFFLLVIGCIPVLLLFVWVRMWFDLAQVWAVARKSRVMRRGAMASWSLARKARALFWDYILTGVIVWIVTIICLMIWAKLSPTALPATILLLELIMLTHIGTRLWQKACATTWYTRNPELVPAVLEPFSPPADLAYQPSVEAQPAVVERAHSDIDPPLSSEIEPAPWNTGKPSENN